MLFLLGAALSLGACGTPEAGSGAAEVYVVRVDGEIGALAAGYVEQVVSEAGEAGARAVALVERPPTFRERFGIPLYAIVLPALLALLAAFGVLLAVLRTSRWRVSTGREGMIGEVGVVRRPVTGSSAGMVFVHGELWQALPEDPDAAPLEADTEVEIVGFRRSAVVVRPAKKA